MQHNLFNRWASLFKTHGLWRDVAVTAVVHTCMNPVCKKSVKLRRNKELKLFASIFTFSHYGGAFSHQYEGQGLEPLLQRPLNQVGIFCADET